MKYHVIYAAFALFTFAMHLLSAMLADYIYYLAEYIWAISIICSTLAIYSGAVTATRTDAAKRGTAIASVTIGAIVLLGLMYSGASWLFIPAADTSQLYG